MYLLFKIMRNTSVTKGKLGTYLLYAMGEILLVVLGILIAIQIDQRIQTAKERAMEIEYLNRLLSELQRDTADFQSNILRAETWINLHYKAHDKLNNPSASDKELVDAVDMIYNQAMFYPKYSPITTTYSELTSSGLLGIIRSDSIREKVIDLYTAYASSVVDYKDFVNKKLDFEVTLWYDHPMLKHLKMTTTLYPEQDTTIMARYIEKNMNVYLNHSAMNVVIKHLIYNHCRRSHRQATHLIQSIQRELTKLE